LEVFQTERDATKFEVAMWTSFKSEFGDWAKQPFSADMPLSHWFLFIGLVLVLIILWNIILANLIEAIRGAT
jgi:hypothetical protein